MDLLSIKENFKEINTFRFISSPSDQINSKNNLVVATNSGNSLPDTAAPTEPVDENITDVPSDPVDETESADSEEVIENDISSYEIEPADHYTTFPTHVIEYFDGVLQNIGHTEYYAYCYYDFNDINGYDVHNYLVYDLVLDGNVIVPGTYPVIDLMQIHGLNGYTVLETQTSFVMVPDVAYGSFGHLSDLRSGFGHTETYALLFFLGFAVVYAALMNFFSFHKRKNR